MFALIYLSFLFHLPARVQVPDVSRWLHLRRRHPRHGVPGAYVRAVHGADSIAYPVLTTIEETLEMFGAVLFLYAMAVYAERDHGQDRPR